VSDQWQGAGWWQASDGKWYPPEQAPAAQTHVPGAPQRATTDEESMATHRRGASPVDAAGATLIVFGIVGGIAWAWEFVRTQFVVDELDSLGARFDLLAHQTPVLLLSGAVAGLGIGLRALAGAQTGSPARPVLGRPVGRVLLVVAATLVVFLGSAAIFGDHDDGMSDLGALYDDPPSIDDLVPVPAPTVTTSDGPTEPTHTLEVHSDGCGVFRSGAIGDDLTWVIKDQDGFQVLGRNAAGETQYRYFQPGTYTVALETWGHGYYVAVSNEVTITC
jgi:hypothetical protein